MDFINNGTVEIARQLLGKKLVVQSGGEILSGWIVETEAYLGPDDRAAHSYGLKRTPKVESMYQEGGTIYVYMIHGHHNMNIVTQKAGLPQGVLIRGLEPCEGVSLMEARRGRMGIEATNGPGKLCKALGVTKACDGTRLGIGPISLAGTGDKIPAHIETSPRIGIPNKGEWTESPLRFFVKGNPYVSKMRKRDCLPVEETWLLPDRS